MTIIKEEEEMFLNLLFVKFLFFSGGDDLIYSRWSKKENKLYCTQCTSLIDQFNMYNKNVFREFNIIIVILIDKEDSIVFIILVQFNSGLRYFTSIYIL